MRRHAALTQGLGLTVSRQRGARLRRQDGWPGGRRRKGVTTPVRTPGVPPAPDLAVVLEAWRRRVAGWAMATHLRSTPVEAALRMAVRQRQPSGVIHHSDHGSQAPSVEFGRRCRAAGIRPSRGSVGEAYDNAMGESCFATLECDRLDRVRLRTPAEAARAVFAFIEGWYNPHRRHSRPGQVSPIRFEKARGCPSIPQSDPVH